jgi:hypothetical protein
MTGLIRARGFPWWIYGLTLVLILVLALAPVISVIVAGSIAEANGCRLDEGSIHACIVNGQDWGGTLYTVGVLGWFMLATIPLGGIALLVWLLILVIHLIARGRKVGPGATDTTSKELPQ